MENDPAPDFIPFNEAARVILRETSPPPWTVDQEHVARERLLDLLRLGKIEGRGERLEKGAVERVAPRDWMDCRFDGLNDVEVLREGKVRKLPRFIKLEIRVSDLKEELYRLRHPSTKANDGERRASPEDCKKWALNIAEQTGKRPTDRMWKNCPGKPLRNDYVAGLNMAFPDRRRGRPRKQEPPE